MILKKEGFKATLVYLFFALFTLAFGQVYTHFGHGVTSFDMTFCFLPTLIGTGMYAIFTFVPLFPCPKGYTAMAIAFAVTCYTLRMIVQGVLDIAGAYSHYTAILSIAAPVFAAIALTLYVITFSKKLKG